MSRRALEALLACFACAAALGVLVVAAFKFDPLLRAEARWMEAIVAEWNSPTYRAASFLAHLVDPVPLVLALAAVCALALRLGRRREAVAALAVVVGANVTTQLLKELLDHHRFQPFVAHQLGSNAFPSGHTTAAASIAVALLLVAPPRLRLPAAILGAAFVAAIGTAVVAIEWHYPSDVVGGVLVASGWGFAALAALREISARASRRRSQAARRFAISTK